jgi:hypothetical protein
MATLLWIIIALIVIAAAAAAVMVARKRRSTALREQFGPEYERTVRSTDSPRAAEAELRTRTKRREQLEVTPLPPAARAHYTQQWQAVQHKFVDDPVTSLSVADHLVTSVMHDRGYIVDDFDTRADLISVDHPNVVENFRVAHDIQERAATAQVSTEDLRTALLRYRSLFQELIRDDNDTVPAQQEEGAR